MLRVNQVQFEALDAYYMEELAERTTATLFQHFPADCEPRGHAAVLDFARASLARARDLEATLEPDLSRYVITEFIVGTEAMAEIVAEERARLLEREKTVDPTSLIFASYRAMFARLKDDRPEPPPDPVYEVIE